MTPRALTLSGTGDFLFGVVGEGTGENLRGLGRGDIGRSSSFDWMVLTASRTLDVFSCATSLGEGSQPFCWFLDILIIAAKEMEGGREGKRERERGKQEERGGEVMREGKREGERERERERGREREREGGGAEGERGKQEQ